MTKYVFLNMPAWGHVNPTLAVVQELVKRGNEVSYYLTEEFREVIEATGATFRPYESKMMEIMKNDPELEKNGPLNILFADRDFVFPQVIDRIHAEKPDVIIYDFMCLWAQAVIKELLIPAITTRATYASNDQFSVIKHMMEIGNLQNMLGAEKASSPPAMLADISKLLLQQEQLNIIFMPRIFHPMAETFDERYVFVGPSIPSKGPATDFPFDKLNNEQPLLYISLGSVFTTVVEFYKQCFEAFRGQPWQVILTIGKSIDLSQLGPIPANFLLSPYAPQLDILPRTSIFVTHAGTNSVMESMYYGVPMVLIPQQPEQQLHAQRAVELGLGVTLDKEAVTATTLRKAVEDVASNATYREHAQSMQQAMYKEGGYQQAADAIIQFAQANAQQKAK